MIRTSKFSDWRKASFSDATGNCVEIAFAADGTVGVRDSKNQGSGPVLEFTPSEWDAFLNGVKGGEFDAQ
jgi:ABC-type amino acid transport substrate-binding protein